MVRRAPVSGLERSRYLAPSFFSINDFSLSPPASLDPAAIVVGPDPTPSNPIQPRLCFPLKLAVDGAVCTSNWPRA